MLLVVMQPQAMKKGDEGRKAGEVAGIEQHEADVAHMLAIGKVYGNPGTDGTWQSNLKFIFINKHPVIGIFFAHRLHPFSKPERIVQLFVMVTLSLWIACVMSDPKYPSVAEDAALRVFINVVLVELLYIFCYQMLAMPSCQDQRNETLYAYRKCFEKFGYVVVGVLALLGCLLSYGTAQQLEMCRERQKVEGVKCPLARTIIDFLESKAISYCGSWFLIATLSFYVKWRKGEDKKFFYDKFNAGLVDTKIVNVDQVALVPGESPRSPL